MGKENIEKYSARYALVKFLALLWHNHFFYRRVIVSGRENINPDDHLIFAPNHQNALMDALAVLFTSPGQPVFLARADIFKRKLIASILYALKILPVFRIRDGFDNLRENDWVFKKTVEVIKNKSGLVILPEGNHAAIRRLRQLKKGICRIAFQAAKETDFKIKIKIIPVGIEFTHYTRMRQVLTVVYGKPIEVSDYYDSFVNNPQKAMNDLKDRLSRDIQSLIVHIDTDDDYESIDELRAIVNSKYADDIIFPKIFRDRVLIQNINKLKELSPEKYRRICDLSLNIKKGVSTVGTDYNSLSAKRHSLPGLIAGSIALILFFPVFLYGLITNLIFLVIPNLSIRNIKDIHFHSSIKYTISLLLALLILPIFLVLCIIFIKPLWIAALAFISVPLSGLFAWGYWLLFRRIIGGFRIRSLAMADDKNYFKLKEQFDELLGLVRPLA